MDAVLEELLPSLVKESIFGEVEFVSAALENETDIGAQFASNLAFINLTLKGHSGEEVLPIVAKIPFIDKEMRELRSSDNMFSNEVIMYKEVLPFLGFDKNCYPNIYYGGVELLVFENLKHKGFVLSKEKVFLDFDHISLITKKIAEFHSRSYILKYTNKEPFFRLTRKFKEVDINDSNTDEYEKMVYCKMEKAFQPLLENEEYADIKKCLNLIKKPAKLRKFLCEPQEPFAVICHGDFCNNNVLYKYDDSGKPVQCVLFDYQLPRYASPAIDLFFFLYMHTTSDFRNKYWDDIIKLYYDTLISFIPNGKECFPKFQDFLKHFAQRAIYGFTISSWFISFIIDEEKVPNFDSLSLEEKVISFVAMGGTQCQQRNVEVVEHMLKKDYIKEFINFCDENNYN